MRRLATATSSTAIATCSKAHRAARSDGARLRAQALLAFAVRRPFRHRRAPGRTSRTTSILFGPRYRGLLADIYDARRAARGFLALSPPSDRDRSAAWRRRGARPSTRSRRCRISASCRSTGTTTAPVYARRASSTMLEQRLMPGLREPDRDQLPLCARAISRTISSAHLGSAFSLEPIADPERLVPRPQSRRRIREPLFRRRGHASGRRHSRRGRQRQGDRRADDRRLQRAERARSLVAEAERIIRARLEVASASPAACSTSRPASAPGCSTPGAAPATISPTARCSAMARSRPPIRRRAIALARALTDRALAGERTGQRAVRRARAWSPRNARSRAGYRRSSGRLRARRRGLAAGDAGGSAALLLSCRGRGRAA